MAKARRQAISDRMEHSAVKFHRKRRDIYDGGEMTSDDVHRRDHEIQRIRESLDRIRARLADPRSPARQAAEAAGFTWKDQTLDSDFMG